MSTPNGPLFQPANAFTKADGTTGYACCDGRSSLPLFQLLAPFGNFAEMRAVVTEAGGDPDEPWCHGCATALEDLRDGFAEGGPLFLQLIASVAAFVPGIGTGVAFALTAAAALANGENISDAMVDAAIGAVPASLALRVAAESGKSLLRGEDIGEAALAGARAVAVAEGGKLGGASFDAVVAISRGKTLQDAGFAGLKSYAAGNTIAERAAVYAEKIASSATTGRSLTSVLEDDLRGDVVRVAGYGGAALVTPVAEAIIRDPKLREAGSQALGLAFGVAEPIARAAQALVAHKSWIDPDLLQRLAPVELVGIRPDVSFRDFLTPEQKIQQAIYRDSMQAQQIHRYGAVDIIREQLAAQRAAAAAPAPAPLAAPELAELAELAELTQAAAIKRTGTAGDVALGATVAAAVVALVWWARAR